MEGIRASSGMTRRRMIRDVTLAVATAASPLALERVMPGDWSTAQARNTRHGRFTDGVISGDPSADGISLWSRLADAPSTATARVHVSADAGFTKTVHTEVLPVRGGRGTV